MLRKVYNQLLTWKNSPDRKPLVLKGARQVGKTYILKEFGRREYDNLIYLNCETAEPAIKQLFEQTLDPKKILGTLELFFNTEITPGKTLIYLDEIQELPRALTALKYFHEEANEFHVVASGSLLGLFIHPGTSFPVGQVDFLHLGPLDFEEFLWAQGEKKLINHIKQDGGEIFDSELQNYLNYYLVVGGMPEVVEDWVANHNLETLDKRQKAVLLAYLDDFSKHADATTTERIRQVFQSLPSQFAKANEKFVYGAIKTGARAREYELAIQWLVDSEVVQKVNRVGRGDLLPLRAYSEPDNFKLYLVDVGLFRNLANIPPSVILQKNAIFNHFNGLLAEQLVLQELCGHELFYWTSGATSEVDFVTQVKDKIVPIEVKSGENVKAKSLRVYLEKYHPEIAVRFSLLPFQRENWLLNIPLYKSWLFETELAKII